MLPLPETLSAVSSTRELDFTSDQKNATHLLRFKLFVVHLDELGLLLLQTG